MANDIGVRVQLQAAWADVVNRLNVASDAPEIAALTTARDQLQQQMDLVEQQGLLAAAGAVATATTVLQATIDTAHTDPVQQFVDVMKSHLDALGASHPLAHAAVAPTSAPSPSIGTNGMISVSHSAKFPDLTAEYSSMFDSCVINPERASLIQQSVANLRANKARYATVAARFANMHWYFVGALHCLEGSFNFKTHLHNGDPLTARTVHVPPGRPPTGAPPFTWEDSAQDALAFENLDRETDYTLPRILYLFEHYNGMGYRQFGLPSPYLWSFSSNYVKGKYGQDGKFDPDLVSKQVGAAVLLKGLQAAGETVA
jgi:lysozyme family protein